jgi:hypothetical protein
VSFKGLGANTNILAVNWQSVESCNCEKWKADNWGRWQFRNPKEG